MLLLKRMVTVGSLIGMFLVGSISFAGDKEDLELGMWKMQSMTWERHYVNQRKIVLDNAIKGLTKEMKALQAKIAKEEMEAKATKKEEQVNQE